MSDEQKVVYKANNEPMAYALVTMLKNNGIEALVVNQGNAFLGGNMAVDWTAPWVVVPADQHAKALPLVEEFDQQLQTHNGGIAWSDDANDERTMEGLVWPKCPHCNVLRPTECPYCHQMGINFVPAYGAQSDEEALTLLCPTCDEPFRPTYFRLCHNCGYDFGSGKQLPVKTAPSEPEINVRAAILLVAVIVVMAALGMYLYSL